MGLQSFWKNYKVLIVMSTGLGLVHWGWFSLKANVLLQKPKEEFCGVLCVQTMKPQSWLRRNWLWAACGAFVTIHLGTWAMQRAVKRTARSEAALKHRPEERVD